MKKCPRCKKNKMHDEQALNSLSRRDNKTYICNDCGNDEAFIDAGMMEPDKLEKRFVGGEK